MPRPDNPYAPRRPGEDLTEVLRRLDLMERKLDWIARRIAVLAHVEGAAPAHEPPAQRVGPAEPGLWPQPSPADAADATEPAEPDRPRPSPADESAPTPSPRPWTPVEPRPRPAAPGASPPVPVRPPVPAALPARIPAAPAVSAGGPGARPAVDPSPAGPAWWERARAEGNIGRYLLSAAATLLIVLAAVSLVALTWESIPDGVKIGSLALAALALVGAGTRLAVTRPGQRVAAATLTGTGGALGFVAVISGVLLDGLVPARPAFGLMALWGLVLLLLSRLTRQVFTAVVSMVGALVTMGFASLHALAHPELALTEWLLIELYALVLAATCALLAGTARQMRWAAWYPVIGVTTTAFAALAAPSRGPLGSTDLVPAALALVVVAIALLHAQVLQAGVLLWNHGWRNVVGWDWAVVQGVTVIVTVVSMERMMPSGQPHGRWTAVALLVLAVQIVAGAAVLVGRWPQGWRPRPLVGLLVGIAVVGTVLLGVEPRAAALLALAVALPVWGLAREGLVWAVLITGAGSAGILLACNQDRPALVSALAAGLVLLAACPLCEAALPDDADPRTRAERRTALRANAWLGGAALVVAVPVLIAGLTPWEPDVARATGAVLMSAALTGLSGLGLFHPDASPLRLVRGAMIGLRPGVDAAGRALTPAPPADTVVAVVVLAVGALVDLLAAGFARFAPALALVVAAVVLTVTADRLLLPWIRRAGAALAAAGLSSLVLWWSIIALSDTRASSVIMTVVALGTGAACILLGFAIGATALRHYGLALVLVAVLKLAVFDVVAQSSLTRILALLVGGVVCFGLSLAYNRAATDAEGAREAREQGASGRPGGPEA